jgi:hypothetical protein
MTPRSTQTVTGRVTALEDVHLTIEQISVGDEVQAADPASGETYARRVLETYVRHDVETWNVVTSAGTVVSTAEHPFYVQGQGWVPVRSLSDGDVLLDVDGSELKVESARPTGEKATVYNFHVNDLHNYHVRAGESWVLVHNTCMIDPHQVRFSQDSVKATFKDGRSIDDLADGLRSGKIKPEDVPAIRVLDRDGVLYTLDNRRLLAFQRADMNVPARWATPDEIARDAFKFTTKNEGTSIRVRGGG